jgi:3D (Asp-Asp-Asp) domain-containing protein
MVIAQSFWRKAVVTVVAATAFVAFYETRMFDSTFAVLDTLGNGTGSPAPGNRLTFGATAYCKGITTTSGVAVQTGIAAADPTVLPVGSVVEVDVGSPKYDGIYTILDTGPSVQGRVLDVYMWSCYEALAFGRKDVRLTVLRLGWNPRSTIPSFIDRFFKRPDNAPEPLPSRPLPQTTLTAP